MLTLQKLFALLLCPFLFLLQKSGPQGRDFWKVFNAELIQGHRKEQRSRVKR